MLFTQTAHRKQAVGGLLANRQPAIGYKIYPLPTVNHRIRADLMVSQLFHQINPLISLVRWGSGRRSTIQICYTACRDTSLYFVLFTSNFIIYKLKVILCNLVQIIQPFCKRGTLKNYLNLLHMLIKLLKNRLLGFLNLQQAILKGYSARNVLLGIHGVSPTRLYVKCLLCPCLFLINCLS